MITRGRDGVWITQKMMTSFINTFEPFYTFTKIRSPLAGFGRLIKIFRFASILHVYLVSLFTLSCKSSSKEKLETFEK